MKVVHFHDPELIVMGLFLRLFGKKVIYDVHENVRQDILHKIWIRKSCRILLSKVAVLLEYMASIFFNGIVAATPIIANNFSNKNTFFIRNFPPLRKQEKYVESNDKKNIIIYIGTLSEARGIKQLIAASEYLEGVAELWLLGGWVNHAFKSECENMIGFKNTKYLGIVSHEDVNKILSKASVGLCTLHSIDTFKDSYPIKVFEYMQNGLPVLMSNFPMWQELFEDSVEYADPLNPIQIAKKIKLMLGNPTRLREMSAKGRILITEKFNWDLESRKLLDLYSRILNQC
jgi:glycosyltransferase involved in cell wall biosynthesis